MWSLVAEGVISLVKGWFQVRKSKQEAEIAYNARAQEHEANYDVKAMEAARFSWKDEFITVIWFSPLVVAWFDADRAMAWVTFVTELPYWWQFGGFGIIAASFGLRWYFKNQGFKITRKDKTENE